MKLKPIKKCVQPHSPLHKVFTSIIESNSNVKKASLSRLKSFGKISAQSHTIVKQICFPDGNVLFCQLFSLSKN